MTADKDGPRDWDKELAQIDKLIAEGKTEPPPIKSAPARGKAATPEESRPVSETRSKSTWKRKSVSG